MSKNKKEKQQISNEAKTCFTFAAGCLIFGILCIIYGLFGYHSKDMTELDNIKTGQTATVISVNKASRNLSSHDKEIEEKKGFSGDELRYEYHVQYQITDEGKNYTYTKTKPYRNGRSAPAVGDTELISYTIKDGELVVSPETRDINQFTISGWFLVILGILSAGVGYFIRK